MRMDARIAALLILPCVGMTIFLPLSARLSVSAGSAPDALSALSIHAPRETDAGAIGDLRVAAA